MVAKQLLEVMVGNNLFDKFQCGLRKNHRTAALRRVNDIIMSTDSQLLIHSIMQSYSTDLETGLA